MRRRGQLSLKWTCWTRIARKGSSWKFAVVTSNRFKEVQLNQQSCPWSIHSLDSNRKTVDPTNWRSNSTHWISKPQQVKLSCYSNFARSHRLRNATNPQRSRWHASKISCLRSSELLQANYRVELAICSSKFRTCVFCPTIVDRSNGVIQSSFSAIPPSIRCRQSWEYSTWSSGRVGSKTNSRNWITSSEKRAPDTLTQASGGRKCTYLLWLDCLQFWFLKDLHTRQLTQLHKND